MQAKTTKNLQDILNAIDEVEGFFFDRPKKFDEFRNNLLLRRAVERNIEIIGEAVNRILKEDPEVTISHARRIVDTRNYISHGYDSVSEDIIRSIVINHLPKQKDEVSRLISNRLHD